MNIRKVIVFCVRQACLCMAGLSFLLISNGIEAKATTYEYDGLNRVTKVIYANKSYIIYEYDANGNIIGQTFYEAENQGKNPVNSDEGKKKEPITTEPDKPDVTDTDKPGVTDTDKPGVTDTDKPTKTDEKKSGTEKYKKGTKVKSKNATYIITSVGEKKTVTFQKLNKKKTSYSIPSYVIIGGDKYKVTKIADNAFKKNTKIKKVTIGKYVIQIGKNTFYGAKKLKKITIKSTVLKKVGEKAFSGIDKKAVINVPKKQYKKYIKLLKGKGQKKTVKIKKS